MRQLHPIYQITQIQEKNMLEDYITDNEVMVKFGFSKGTLANYRSEGKLPYTKFGPSIVYKVLDIVDFLERNRIQKNMTKKDSTCL